jgi:hypothetical protein
MSASSAAGQPLTLTELAGKITELERRIALLEDARAIADLQARYIYYLQAHDYEKIVDLFAREEEVSVEMDNVGLFIGREKAAAVFTRILKPLYPMKGAMGLHLLTTPVVEVHREGRLAWGMWHTLGCNTQPNIVASGSQPAAVDGLIALWQQGKYFIDFVKEHGEWKWKNFRWFVNFRTPYDKGWVKQPISGNLAQVRTFLPDAPEPDGPSEYHPYSPEELTPYRPLPPPPHKR